MKNIYSILSLFLLLFSISVFGQSDIYAPNLRAPENSEIDQMPDVILDWDAVTGITLDITYEAQLATNPEFTDAVTFPRTDVTAETMSNLQFGGVYYWRVRAYDEEEVSDWSEIWSFTVVWTVAMDKPTDGDEVFANPEISWDELTGISGYQMELDTVYAWSFEESGVTADLNASYIVADNDMWTVGSGGLILHNDGTGWVNVESGTTEDLFSVTFIDASNGYAAGDGGTVLHYDGNTWTIVDIGVETDLTGVSFSSADHGVVVGDTGVIVINEMGTWDLVETGDKNDLYDVVMLNTSNIWACGVGNIVVNYDGSEWFANEIGTKDHYAITMIDENTGWTVGDKGKIFRWDGLFWYEEETPSSKDLFGVSFSGMNGYAVGEDGTMHMFNGSWNQITSGVSEDLQGVMITGDNGLIVGNNGIIKRKVDNGFNSPYLATFDIPSDTASWVLSNLLFGETYYYRLRAIHGADTSSWSGVKSMTTYASPELDSPSNSSETDLLIEFEWDEYEGITNYIFEIDMNENFTNPGFFTPEDETLTLFGFVYGQEYFWRVAAEHVEDISDWSEVWSFNTVNTIILESPANEAVEVNPCPLFTWEEVLGSSEYELWIDIDEAFTDPHMYTVEDPFNQCQSTMEKNTVYYWKVRGVSGTVYSEWSDVWWFKTEGYIGIDEQFNADAIVIYPNPGNGEFNLYIDSFGVEDYQISVIDISGRLVYEAKISCQAGSNIIPVSINNIGNGAYNLIISNGEQIVTKRLLIK